jgi:hypothetical protein
LSNFRADIGISFFSLAPPVRVTSTLARAGASDCITVLAAPPAAPVAFLPQPKSGRAKRAKPTRIRDNLGDTPL